MMKKSPDYIIAQYINWLPKLFVLNFAWILYSLPLLTVGAATRSLLYTMMDSGETNDGGILDYYHRVFKRVIKKHSRTDFIWSLYLLLLVLNIILSLNSSYPFSPLITYLLEIIGTVALFIYIYQCYLECEYGTLNSGFWVAFYYFCRKPLFVGYHYIITVLLGSTLIIYMPAFFLMIGSALIFGINLKLASYKIPSLLN